MPEELLKNRLSFWKILAEKNQPIKNDTFIKFMIYWLIFDGYISTKSSFSSDSEKLKWFSENETPLRNKFEEHFESPFGKGMIAFFQDRNGVKNEAPNPRRERAEIDEVYNLLDVMKVIHQVRCNLFHGSKDRMSPDDEKVVSAALELIQKPINLWLL